MSDGSMMWLRSKWTQRPASLHIPAVKTADHSGSVTLWVAVDAEALVLINVADINQW